MNPNRVTRATNTPPATQPHSQQHADRAADPDLEAILDLWRKVPAWSKLHAQFISDLQVAARLFQSAKLRSGDPVALPREVEQGIISEWHDRQARLTPQQRTDFLEAAGSLELGNLAAAGDASARSPFYAALAALLEPRMFPRTNGEFVDALQRVEDGLGARKVSPEELQLCGQVADLIDREWNMRVEALTVDQMRQINATGSLLRFLAEDPLVAAPSERTHAQPEVDAPLSPLLPSSQTMSPIAATTPAAGVNGAGGLDKFLRGLQTGAQNFFNERQIKNHQQTAQKIDRLEQRRREILDFFTKLKQHYPTNWNRYKDFETLKTELREVTLELGERRARQRKNSPMTLEATLASMKQSLAIYQEFIAAIGGSHEQEYKIHGRIWNEKQAAADFFLKHGAGVSLEFELAYTASESGTFFTVKPGQSKTRWYFGQGEWAFAVRASRVPLETPHDYLSCIRSMPFRAQAYRSEWHSVGHAYPPILSLLYPKLRVADLDVKQIAARMTAEEIGRLHALINSPVSGELRVSEWCHPVGLGQAVWAELVSHDLVKIKGSDQTRRAHIPSHVANLINEYLG